jgi:hypothetical protein
MHAFAGRGVDGGIEERRRHRRYDNEGNVTYRRLGPPSSGGFGNPSGGGQSPGRSGDGEMEERRRHRRYDYDGPVTYRQLGPSAPGRIRNLSEGGLMIELGEPLTNGTVLDIEVTLGSRSIHAEAEVVWSRVAPEASAPSYLHGLKFTRLELQDRLTLAVYIAKVYGG